MPDTPHGTTADPVAVQRNVLTIRGKPHEVCAACPVQRGECPRCGTFWTLADGGGTCVYGVVRVDQGYADGPTTAYPWLDRLPNVIAREPAGHSLRSVA